MRSKQHSGHRGLRRWSGRQWVGSLPMVTLAGLIAAFVGSEGAMSVEVADLQRMLPDGTSLNPKVTPPEVHLGWKIGTRHVRHDEVVSYAQRLAGESQRVSWIPYGRTHGHRPLGMLLYCQPDRQSQLDKIVEQRQAWVRHPKEAGDLASHEKLDLPPSVAWLGYSVHGDEASGVNASMLVMYVLAAAEGPWIDGLLERHILMVDPSLNPDGIDRFAHWVNDHRGHHPSSDRAEIEHQQAWPRGRTNHYNFDLNRDWLPATQPESRGRLELFHRWLPNLVLDFHEMDSDQSLFFQPGVEGRDHPLTPPLVRDVTQGIARRYADTMDRVGQRYYTQERFDDFYPGKASTYPDLHGSVGILVEQGSTRGLVHDYAGGVRRFEDTVLNPFRLTLATLAGLEEYHRVLLEHQRDFYLRHRDNWLQPSAYVIKIPSDRRIASEFLRLLSYHHISLYQLAKPVDHDGLKIDAPKDWWIVPSDQPQGKFMHVMMDRTKEFPFKQFYDISAWNMGDAYGLDWHALKSDQVEGLRGEEVSLESLGRPNAELDVQAVALAFPGHFVHSMTLVDRLMQKEVVLRVAKTHSRVRTSMGEWTDLSIGSLIAHRADQTIPWGDVVEHSQAALRELELEAIAIDTSLTAEGPDLGSDQFPLIEVPRLAMLVGEGTNITEAGSLWFTVDRLLDLPIARIEPAQLVASTLQRYTCLIVPDGESSRLPTTRMAALREWVMGGGHVVLVGRSVALLPILRDAEAKAQSSKAVLAESDGFILSTRATGTNWFAKTLGNGSIKVFQSDGIWPVPDAPILVTSADSPVIAGYVREGGQGAIAGKTVMGISKLGGGQVTSMTFNPTFRGHYWGSIGLLRVAVIRERNP